MTHDEPPGGRFDIIETMRPSGIGSVRAFSRTRSMNTQRIISDAKRRAKSLSRTTGRSHQTHLDEIAAAAGRSDWAAFVADPVPLSPIREDDMDESPPSTNARSMTHRLRAWLRWRVLAGAGASAVGLALVVLVLAIASRPLYGRDLGSAVTLDAQRRTVATLSLPTMTGEKGRSVNVAGWVKSGNKRDVLITFIDNRPTPPTGLLDGMKRWATGFPNAHGPGPVAMLLNWIRTGYTQGSIGEGSMGLYHSYFEHRVARARYDIDCDTGGWHMTDVQTADDFVSPPAYSAVRNGAPASKRIPHPLTATERDALCSSDVINRTRALMHT